MGRDIGFARMVVPFTARIGALADDRLGPRLAARRLRQSLTSGYAIHTIWV